MVALSVLSDAGATGLEQIHENSFNPVCQYHPDVIGVLLTLLWIGLLTWLVAVLWTVWALMRPPRLTPARAMARIGRMSPSDLGLRFFEGEVHPPEKRTRRSLRLVYWFMPRAVPSENTAVLIHGYADSRIGALAWAPLFIELGWNVVAVDLRAHGESGGTFTTAGIRERHDINHLINEIRAQRPQSTRNLILFGASMGATIALAAAAQRDDLAGVILDSPVADFYHGAATQLSLMGLAGKSILAPGLALVELWLGERFSSIAPARLIPALKCPVLAICPSDDPFLPPQNARELAAVIARKAAGDGISHLAHFDAATHLLSMQQNPVRYKECLNQFCDACKSNSLARRAGGDAGELSPCDR